LQDSPEPGTPSADRPPDVAVRTPSSRPAAKAPTSVPDHTTTSPAARTDSAPVESGDAWRQMMQQLQGASPSPAAVPQPVPSPDAAVSPVGRKPGTLRVDGVFPIGLRVPRLALSASAAGHAWPSLQAVADAVATCAACGLAQTATRPVPGVGDPAAEVLVVGEAPGEQEDLRGEPFVGPAGELLNKILGAIQLERSAVYICNVLKHRPPGNRNPLPDEVRACAPFLQRQIDLVQPRIILAFGTFAAQSLLGTKLGIGKLRQQLHWYQDIPLVVTYHPAALLRNEAWKRPTWEDIKLARRILDATIRA
jgi:uracil-DNA glycosylase